MQRPTRLLPDNPQTTQRLFLVTPHYLNMLALGVAGWVVITCIIIPLHGSIFQAETCQILSLAENPKSGKKEKEEENDDGNRGH